MVGFFFSDRVRIRSVLTGLRSCSSRQFLFVVTFTTFLFNCVEYDVLFADRAVNHTGPGVNPLDRTKVTLPDAVLPPEQCAERSVWPGFYSRTRL